MSKFTINLHQVIFSLSAALDLVGIDQTDHSKRVAYIASECGKALSWNREHLDNLFLAAILHDCGISNTDVHSRLTHFEGKNVGNHCTIGAELLGRIPLLADTADYVLHHHTPWTEIVGLDLSDAVKIGANCIYLADRIDILALNSVINDPDILSGREEIRRKIKAKSNYWFHPELVDIFVQISEAEAFWLALEKARYCGHAAAWIEQNPAQEIEFSDLKNILLIFSHIVDEKSSYTRQHSDGVAKLSRRLGELFNLSVHTCDKLELTGLLHDLGKLRVPDKILDKPGKLTQAEYFIMQRHSFDSYDILSTIKGFEDIALWASQHHERIDGSGYPYRSKAKDLSLEAKIIAVADVFQALTQRRPHRDKFSAADIMTELNRQMRSNKLDSEVVSVIENNLAECFAIGSVH